MTRTRIPAEEWIDRVEDRLNRLETLLNLCIGGIPEEFRGFNGQAGRQQIVRELVEACEIQTVVETGTYLGDTAGWVSKELGLLVWSCEIDDTYLSVARERLENLSVVLARQDSRTWLREIVAISPIGLPLFYLDAHWGAELPLADELRYLCGALAHTDYVIMVDDFEVPGDEGYGFDDFGPGARLTLEDFAALFQELGLTAYFPALPSKDETPPRRGCVVLVPESMVSRVETVKGLTTSASLEPGRSSPCPAPAA